MKANRDNYFYSLTYQITKKQVVQDRMHTQYFMKAWGSPLPPIRAVNNANNNSKYVNRRVMGELCAQ